MLCALFLFVHKWSPATCTEAQKCVICGKEKGEPLGHDWEDANCTDAKCCRRCGEIGGEPLGHDWKAATCTQAEACKRCGMINGESLGHTTSFGFCERCGELIGREILEGINQDITDLITTMRNSAINAFDPQTFMTSSLQKLASFYHDVDVYYAHAITLCGDISELSVLKSKMINVRNMIPNDEKEVTEIVDFIAYMNSFTVFFNASTEVQAEWQPIREKYGLPPNVVFN